MTVLPTLYATVYIRFRTGAHTPVWASVAGVGLLTIGLILSMIQTRAESLDGALAEPSACPSQVSPRHLIRREVAEFEGLCLDRRRAARWRRWLGFPP